jgi:hypothetical protein
MRSKTLRESLRNVWSRDAFKSVSSSVDDLWSDGTGTLLRAVHWPHLLPKWQSRLTTKFDHEIPDHEIP